VHQLPSSVQAQRKTCLMEVLTTQANTPPPSPPYSSFPLQRRRHHRCTADKTLQLFWMCAVVCVWGGTGWQLSMDPYGRPVYVPLGTAPPGTTVVGSMAPMGAARGQPIATAPPASLTQPLTLTHPPATSSVALLSSLRTLTLPPPPPSLQAGSSGARDQQQLTCLCRVRLLLLDSSAAWMGGR
jgi:hypothetical protein